MGLGPGIRGTVRVRSDGARIGCRRIQPENSGRDRQRLRGLGIRKEAGIQSQDRRPVVCGGHGQGASASVPAGKHQAIHGRSIRQIKGSCFRFKQRGKGGIEREVLLGHDIVFQIPQRVHTVPVPSGDRCAVDIRDLTDSIRQQETSLAQERLRFPIAVQIDTIQVVIGYNRPAILGIHGVVIPQRAAAQRSIDTDAVAARQGFHRF